MISPEEARKIILRESPPLGEESVSLSEALGRVLSREIHSPIDLPPHDHSAMDGFALRAKDTEGAVPQHPRVLEVLGDHPAGAPRPRALEELQAYRIMTGAMLPPGADSVVMQEKAQDLGDRVRIMQPVSLGANVRRRGEELKRGSLGLRSGQYLNSRHLGFLAQMGLDPLRVYRKPKVGVVITGSELISPGEVPEAGKQYDSNGTLLSAGLQEEGIRPVFMERVKDHPEKLFFCLSRAMREADMVLLTGGVSVGKYDFSKKVLEKLSVRRCFWGVAQKPGKPLFFGKIGSQLIFGLPGNPASAWICFYLYVRPALWALQGRVDREFMVSKLPLTETVKMDPKKTVFLKGIREASGVRPLQGQGSHMLSSLAEADSLLEIPPREAALAEGAKVSVYSIEKEVMK